MVVPIRKFLRPPPWQSGMRSVRSTVERIGSSPTVGAVFSIMVFRRWKRRLRSRLTPLGPAYSFPNYSILPLLSYRFVLITTAYILYRIWTVNPSGLSLGRVPSGQRLSVGSSPTVGAIFSAMKTEYVVVAKQAHPFGPSLFISHEIKNILPPNMPK